MVSVRHHDFPGLRIYFWIDSNLINMNKAQKHLECYQYHTVGYLSAILQTLFKIAHSVSTFGGQLLIARQRVRDGWLRVCSDVPLK